MFRYRSLAVLGLAALSVTSFSQIFGAPGQEDSPYLGVKAGLTWFSNSEMRDVFGNGKMTFGFSPVRGPKNANGMKLGTNLDFLLADRDGSRLAVIPLTMGMESAVGGDYTGVKPYFAVRGGFAYADYAINRPGGGRSSGKTIVPTGNVELGFAVNKNLIISARYNLMSKVNGMDFSGLSFQATYAALRF